MTGGPAGTGIATARGLATGWHPNAGLVAALAGIAAAYGLAVWRVRRWPPSRTAAFLTGLGVVAVALGSDLDADADRLLSAHMGQHLLLTLAAPALLALGAPVSLALRACHGRRRAWLARVVRAAPVRVLANPAVALATFAATLMLVHLPVAYEAALRNPGLHVAEHFAFGAAGFLLWTSVLGAEPVAHRLGAVGRTVMLLLATVPMGAVGAWLVSAPAVRYGFYLAAGHGGPAVLADQQLAGALMWVGGRAPPCGRRGHARLVGAAPRARANAGPRGR